MIESVRPEGDNRRTAVFVFNELKADGGRLTQLWLERLRQFSRDGWATHAALINRDAKLEATVATLVARGRLPQDTTIHHFPARDRRIRPAEWATPEPGVPIDPVVSDWLDWLTGQLPGVTVFADSPAAYPYLAGMTNPLVSLVAGIHLNHLVTRGADGPFKLTPRFVERFGPVVNRFDALVVMTQAQARDLRAQFGADLPVRVIPASASAPKELAPTGAREPGLIVSVGKLESAAHHAEAINALALVVEQVPEARLEIVGSGAPEVASSLLALAAELGLAERVSIRPPGKDPNAPFAPAAVALWTARRDSTPMSVLHALLSGVPVVANDAPYGPAELVTPATGVLVDTSDATACAQALVRVLTQPSFTEAAIEAAPGLRAVVSPATVGRAWRRLAADLEDELWDRDTPIVNTLGVLSTNRIFRMPGVIVNSALPFDQWYVELPGLQSPAGFLSDPRVRGSWNHKTRGPDPAFDPARRVRPIIVHLRSNALAYVATKSQESHTLSLTDGAGTIAPILAARFPRLLIVSRAGNAQMSHQPDGTVAVAPLPEMIYATEVDGRVHSKLDEDSQPTDVTHAISWGVDIDWADLEAAADGVRFTGLLRAKRIAPALDSTPAICVRDAGGYSRVVGQMHYLSDAEVDDQSFLVRVGGVIATDPLVATTQIARGALALHVGFRGLLHPVGGLWTHGRRSPIFLSCERGQVTVLPSPGGRVLAAPGRGRRARVLGSLRTMLRK